MAGTTVRRRLLVALAAALCVAAATGIVAILTGNFDSTEANVLLTSLAFAVFSATSAPGGSLRLGQSEGARLLGSATIGLSVASFLLMTAAVWTEDDDTLWRTFGCFGFAAFACSHAALVTGARRRTDGPAVDALFAASLVLGAADALFGVLGASGAVDRIDRGVVELIAVTVILLVLTTVLQPIARRPASPRPAGDEASVPASVPVPSAPREPQGFAAAVLAAADRIDAFNGDPGNRAPDIRREVERLRELVRIYSR